MTRRRVLVAGRCLMGAILALAVVLRVSRSQSEPSTVLTTGTTSEEPAASSPRISPPGADTAAPPAVSSDPGVLPEPVRSEEPRRFVVDLIDPAT